MSEHSNLIPITTKQREIVITIPDNITNSVTKEDLNHLAIYLREKLPIMLQSSFEEIKAMNEIQTKNNNKRFDVIEEKIEMKEITSAQLKGLRKLIKDKATMYVTKNAVQLTIDSYVNNSFAIGYEKLVKREIAKVCKRMWRELKTEELKVSPYKFKNDEIKCVDVDRCFEFVRKWGGFYLK